MQRHHHCELAFEEHLRRLRLPYVAVDEARKSLLPPESGFDAIKSFDFLVSLPNRSLLVDIKGRKLRMNRSGRVGKLENWVTRDDLRSLAHWEQIFGPKFQAVFVFAYWSDIQPPDGVFDHLLHHRDRWYALRCIDRASYEAHARTRSPKWETVDLDARVFSQLATGLTPDRNPYDALCA
ncbi:MAG: HYExAFE family protein [Phycisphaerales bacterium JB065]